MSIELLIYLQDLKIIMTIIILILTVSFYWNIDKI